MGLFKKNKKTKESNELEVIGKIDKKKVKKEYTGLEFSEDDDEIMVPISQKELEENTKQEKIVNENEIPETKLEDEKQDDLNFQIPHTMLNYYNYILDLESRIRILESDWSKLYPAYAELVTMYNSLVPLLDKKESGEKNK